MGEASIDVDKVQSHRYGGIMKKKLKTKRSVKAASNKAAETKHNKATDAVLAGIENSLLTKKAAAPTAEANGGAKPNVRFNNFEKRATFEAVAQLHRTGGPAMKSACDKLRLMGWDKHEMEAKK
jgi:hypothetical protein